jgi:hypothetical protein
MMAPPPRPGGLRTATDVVGQASVAQLVAQAAQRGATGTTPTLPRFAPPGHVRVARVQPSLRLGDTVRCQRAGCLNRVVFTGGIKRYCSRACRKAAR